MKPNATDKKLFYPLPISMNIVGKCSPTKSFNPVWPRNSKPLLRRNDKKLTWRSWRHLHKKTPEESGRYPTFPINSIQQKDHIFKNLHYTWLGFMVHKISLNESNRVEKLLYSNSRTFFFSFFFWRWGIARIWCLEDLSCVVFLWPQKFKDSAWYQIVKMFQLPLVL